MAELIRDRYGIKLAVRTMGLYLTRWGFTPQKPMKKAYEQSPAAVQEWLGSVYGLSSKVQCRVNRRSNSSPKKRGRPNLASREMTARAEHLLGHLAPLLVM